jgi:hypothetical protein
MKKNCFPLPQIDNTLDTLARANWFSNLDPKNGYWWVDLRRDNKEKAAFLMGQGLWQFTVMSFALCNVPVTCKLLIETILRSVTYESCPMYLDDMIGCTFQEHLLNLRKVFQQFQETYLKLNLVMLTLSEGSTMPQAYCITCRDYHRPQEAESHTRMADPEEQT